MSRITSFAKSGQPMAATMSAKLRKILCHMWAQQERVWQPEKDSPRRCIEERLEGGEAST